MYVRRIAAEGLKGKVEEVLRGLVGGMREEDEEEAESVDEEIKAAEEEAVCGWDRRELLKMVVLAVGKQRELQRVVVPYARLLGVLDEEMEKDV